jgi:hypothetical protein
MTGSLSGKHFRPVPGDPSADQVEKLFEAGADWINTVGGDIKTSAVLAMKKDGTDEQFLVAVEWGGRHNHTREPATVQVLVSPEDAIQIGEQLIHSGTWLRKMLDEAGKDEPGIFGGGRYIVAPGSAPEDQT